MELFCTGDRDNANIQEDIILKVGDSVNFHALINGPITSTGHVITSIHLMPNNFGEDVAWITEKTGCVALAALTKTQKSFSVIGTTRMGKVQLFDLAAPIKKM